MKHNSLFVVLLAILAMPAHALTVGEHIEQFTQRLELGETIDEFERPVHAASVVALFFRLRNYEPIWVPSRQAAVLIDELKAADAEGLFKEDYHYDHLLQLYEQIKAAGDPQHYRNAQFELLMTDALLVYGYHLLAGKVDPSNIEKTWNYDSPQLLKQEVVERLNDYAENNKVREALQDLKPKLPLYLTLKKGLALYNELAATRSFMPIEATAVLKPGEESNAVSLLRRRLADLHYLSLGESDSDSYDALLEQAVREFQEYHSLAADGVIGRETWLALNVPYAERADQIRINLERTRWVAREATDDLIAVNIAGFQLYYVRDHAPIWSTDVMTGTVRHETPVFKSRITYLEFNPTWTVPRSILRRSLINKFKNNPQAIVDGGYYLYDRDGNQVDTDGLDWATLGKNNFPYTVVQQPSDKNALGQVKFIFPNEHAIYLHDTPSKALFSKSARAFSAGCVRVKNPFELARLLLNDDEKWSAEKIQEVVDSRERKRVVLNKPTDVMLMYWTAAPGDKYPIRFTRDIYNRDKGLLVALKEPL